MRREGKRIRTEHLEVRALASLLPYPRVGFVVPKYKRNGVARNQLKRRLREIVRTRVLPTLPPGDLVIRPNPAAYDAPFERLVAELAGAADRARRALASARPVVPVAPRAAHRELPPTAPPAPPEPPPA